MSLNEKYLSSQGENPFAEDSEEMSVSGTIDQVATEFYGEKGKIYMFSLGFQPTTNDISEFEQILRNDFDGEIEIYTNSKPYKTIRYKDFDSFAWHPGNDVYGPVYNFKIEPGPAGYSIKYSFRPKIRSNKLYTYSFYLQRVSFGERLKNLFRLKTQDGQSKRADDTKYYAQGKELNIPAKIERIGVKIEKKDVHIMDIALPLQKEKPWQENSGNYKNYDGVIEIYQNGDEYLVMPNRLAKNRISSLYFMNHTEMSHTFFIDKPGIYSFILKMKSKNEFEFSFSVCRCVIKM